MGQDVGTVPGGVVTVLPPHPEDSGMPASAHAGQDPTITRGLFAWWLSVTFCLFPVRVLIQAGALCWSLPELSQGEGGKGACAGRSREAQTSAAFS